MTRRQETGRANQSIYWVRGIYSQAHYYRGFVAVKDRRYEDALRFLNAGLAIDPDAPLLRLEKGKALASLHRYEEALDEYRAVAERDLDVAPTPRAVAWRGIGYQCIELKRLDEADAAFRTSLKIDPKNKIALNELAYIDHLRKGGPQTFGVTAETPTAEDRCRVCGTRLAETNGGSVISADGQILYLCANCEKKMERRRNKKWWQFWL